MATVTGKNKVRYDFKETEVQGDDFLGFACQLSINGSYEDLTDAVIVAKFRSNRTDGSFDKTSAAGEITITDPTNGIFQIESFSLATYPTGTYDYAITITPDGGLTRTRVYGQLIITDEVNRK